MAEQSIQRLKAVSANIERVDRTQLLAILSTVVFIYIFVKATYNVTLHPLAHYPGPFLARATSLPYVFYLGRGRVIDWVVNCHETYGHVVRVVPDELSYCTEEAWRDIYNHDSPSAGRKWRGLYDKRNPQMDSMQGAEDDKISDDHKVLRRIFGPAFSEKNLRDFEPMFKRTMDLMVDKIKRVTQEKPFQPINMTEFVYIKFMYITFDIMGDFTFAQSFGMIEQMKYLDWIAAQYRHVKFTIVVMSSAYLAVLRPIITLLMWAFQEPLNAPLIFATEKVNARIKKSAPEQGRDIWALCLRENKFDRKLTHKEMCANALLFLLAGTETTATSMTGLLWYLHVHPIISSKLTDEIRSSFTSSDDITMQRCSELKYLNACIEEVLRVYAPVKIGMPRVTPPEGMIIDGQYVPGETVVSVSIHAANVSADNFRNPEKFIPERWISDEYASDKKGARQPFIVGLRNCLGKAFAYHEMRLVIATLIFSFDIQVREECDDWGVNQKVYGLAQKGPLLVDFKPRF